MATSKEFIEFVCDQIAGIGDIRYRKMFGEYLVYVNEKPVITVCDNTAFVKEVEEIADKMQKAEKGYPYEGAKEHYILDIDHAEFCKEIVTILEKVTPLPKKKNKK